MAATEEVAGVFLASETSSQPSHQLGSVLLPAQDQPATKLRELLLPFFPAGERRRFVFLTSHGWEVNETMEHTMKVGALVWEDRSVRVRLKFPRTRLALVVQTAQGGEQALGFIFVEEMKSSAASLRGVLARQHPELEKRLRERGYVFLDSNHWPVSPNQEEFLWVLDIVQNHSIVVSPSVATSFSTIDWPGDTPSHTSLPLPALSSHSHRMIEQTDSSEGVSQIPPSSSNTKAHEVLISYVHKEATAAAILLKTELERLQFSVFLDVDSIEVGTDWQDSLNNAVSNCSVFVPLVTQYYGKTLWTNREIKLADILGKLIIPINFLSEWPPRCLAIQFATTQFLSWNSQRNSNSQQLLEMVAKRVAAEIAEVATAEDIKCSGSGGRAIEVDSVDSGADSTSVPPTPTLPKVPTLKSCGSLLPTNTPDDLRKSVLESREGKPLVVIVCHPEQHQFAMRLSALLEGQNYEVWCSSGVCASQEEFKQKVDEAGAVIIVLSKGFSCCNECEQRVYYSEGRKRIIPVIQDSIEMPPWMSKLIGTSTFLDARSSSFDANLLERIQVVFNPITAEEEMRMAKQEEEELSRLSISLSQQLPTQRLVYISGGTKFHSRKGEAICKELGKQLARKRNTSLITGGFYGVGETVGMSFAEERGKIHQPVGVTHVIAKKDEQDKSTQTRQNKDYTFPPPPYGHTIIIGNSVRQREMLVPRVLEVCVLVEGGPGAAFETEQFIWNEHQVIPVPVTGGAASGLFSVPQSIFSLPDGVEESDWLMLQDDSASPFDVAAAIVRVIDALKPEK